MSDAGWQQNHFTGNKNILYLQGLHVTAIAQVNEIKLILKQFVSHLDAMKQ